MMKKIICKINKDITLELRDVKKVYGHDDSLPFNADVYIHKPDWCECLTFAGRAWNDGWGGDSVIDANTKPQRELVDKLNTYLKENYQVSFRNVTFDVELPFLIDCLVYRALCDYKRVKITDIEDVSKKEAA